MDASGKNQTGCTTTMKSSQSRDERQENRAKANKYRFVKNHGYAPEDFADTCRDLGATWLLTSDLLESDSHEKNLERIREGPPA
jgi:hypothetical protein